MTLFKDIMQDTLDIHGMVNKLQILYVYLGDIAQKPRGNRADRVDNSRDQYDTAGVPECFAA